MNGWAKFYERQRACAVGSRPFMKDLLAEVCQRHGCEPDAVKRRHGPWALSRARQEFMYLAMTSGRSSMEVARFLGGRHHTTVLTGARLHAERLQAVLEAA